MPDDRLNPLLADLRRRAESAPPVLVGITGAVAVGKSTLAEHLRSALSELRVAVVGTDGFLKPNAQLEAEGIFDRKGFPQSHDLDRVRTFLDAVRRKQPADAPIYSHETFDVVPGKTRRIAEIDALILEGVVALEESVAARLDMKVFVDADPAAIESWYHARRARLYGDSEAIRQRGKRLWTTVNRPNFERNIVSGKARADWIVVKAADHTIVEVISRAG